MRCLPVTPCSEARLDCRPVQIIHRSHLISRAAEIRCFNFAASKWLLTSIFNGLTGTTRITLFFDTHMYYSVALLVSLLGVLRSSQHDPPYMTGFHKDCCSGLLSISACLLYYLCMTKAPGSSYVIIHHKLSIRWWRRS